MSPAPAHGADTAPVALDLDESVRLGQAVVDDLAARHDIRCLAIKGPVLATQGLREPRGSVDVDVLIDPARFEEFLDTLVGLGWVDQGPFEIPSVMRRHSVTLRHRAWACELDVHRYYPGFLAADERTFEVLWTRRVTVQLAGRALVTCDPVGHAALAALHYLRDQRSHDLDRLVAVVRDGWPEARVDALVELAHDVGAERTLEPFLTAIGRPVHHRAGPDPAFEEWSLRSQARTQVGLAWLVELRRTPWGRRPAVLWRAAWLSEPDLRLAHPGLKEGWRPLAQARLARLRRGLAALPTAARDVRGRAGAGGSGTDARAKPPRPPAVRASAGQGPARGAQGVQMSDRGSGAPTVAIAHDYLTQRGGAERVVLSMARAFPDAPIYTTLYDPEGTFAAFADLDVRVSPLNRVGPLRRHHRAALPFLPWASSRIRIDADVVLCSSSGWSHGFEARGPKVVYCYSPARWLYQSDTYLGDRQAAAGGAALRLLKRPLVRWDQRAARTVERYVAISEVVRHRIRSTYGIEADVLAAPVAPEFLGAVATRPAEPRLDGLPHGFFLCVSRLLPYKNVDAVAEAFRDRDETLVVVGRGPERERLAAQVPGRVVMLEGLTDGEMRWLYEHCVGLVAASHEDFGLTPLEAAACGRPSAVLQAGGFLDTMTDQTAVFFERPEPDSISAALDRLLLRTWDRDAIRAHAASFGADAFAERLQHLVSETLDQRPREDVR